MAYLPGTTEKGPVSEPEQIVLKSSFLSHASYDATNYAITISFKTGYTSIHKFAYPSVWAAFKIAPSHGSYYANVLKKQYPAVPLTEKLRVSDLTKAKKEFRAN